MEEIKKLIEEKIEEQIKQIDFQLLLLRSIEEHSTFPALKKYIRELEIQSQKEQSVKSLTADALENLRSGRSDKKNIVTNKVMTRTYLKNGYSILDFDYEIKMIEDGEVDISTIFGYEKDNIHYPKVKKIIEKLQDNFIKSKQFSVRNPNEDFQLSNRFNECFYMTVIKKDGELSILETEAEEYDVKDPETGEILTGIKISVPVLNANKGETIKVMQSFTMPNSMFTSNPFPDKIKYNTPSAYTKIRVQEEIYGNPHKMLKPSLKKSDSGTICKPINKGSNLYYYFYEWEFFYDKRMKEIYELEVLING